jgi:bifunctional DNA-binding transcriptional regulator/antitoxin component of YhaV-PrlF toxin-antitoxin module
MRFIRKINKTAKRSYSVIIPMKIIKKLGWKERQKIVLSLRGKVITIKDWEK